MNDEGTPIAAAETGGAQTNDANTRTAGRLPVPFFTCREPSRRRLNAVLQLGLVSFALWILSLYFAWDTMTGKLVNDPVNLWFNCIPVGALAVTTGEVVPGWMGLRVHR